MKGKSGLEKLFLVSVVTVFVLGWAAGCSSSDKAEGYLADQAAVSSNANIAASGGRGETSVYSEAAEPAMLASSDQAVPGTAAMTTMEGINRKLIYNADVRMEVANFKQSEADIRSLVQDAGGYILEFSEENYGDNHLGGTFVLKIPSTGFMPFLDHLEQMNRLSMERSVKGEDVTERYVDLESRLKAKQVIEIRLLSFMEQAGSSEALLQFSQELAKVQEEIERLKGQLRYLDQNAAFSTIHLHLFEKAPPALQMSSGPLSLGERMKAALLNSSNGVVAFVQSLLVFIAGALPVLLLLSAAGIPGYWFLRKWQRRHKNDAASTED